MIKSSVLFTLVTTIFAASAEECSTVELAGFLAGYAGFANAVDACSAGSGGVSQLIDPGDHSGPPSMKNGASSDM